VEKLYSGKYECPSCGAVFQADDDPESELVCDDCDESLEPFEVEDDEEAA